MVASAITERVEGKSRWRDVEKKKILAYRCKVTVPCAFAVEFTVAAHSEISEHVMGVHGLYIVA